MEEIIKNSVKKTWNWTKVTMFLLGLVYVYQFAKINFLNEAVAYDVEVTNYNNKKGR